MRVFFIFALVLLAVAEVCAGAPYGIPPPNKTAYCNYGLSLEWTTRVSSSIFATPVIADLMHDGKKEILIPTFSQYLEAVNGANGEDVPGYPFVHPKFKSYASPIPVDIDGDGKVEWLVAMYTGELLLFNQEGKARGLLQVPPLAVKRNWMNITDGTGIPKLDKLAAIRMEKGARGRSVLADIARMRRVNDLYLAQEPQHPGAVSDGVNRHYQPRRRFEFDERGVAKRQAMPAAVDVAPDAHGDGVPPAFPPAGDEGRGWEDELIDDDDFEFFDDDGMMNAPFEDLAKPKALGPDGRLSPEAKASMGLLFDPDLYRAKVTYDEEKDAFSTRHLRGTRTITVMQDEIAVDAHLLSNPRIVDIDGNGDLDVVLHVSYFFDVDAKGAVTGGRPPLPEGVDPANYAATAVVCMNLVTGDLKWVHVLHLGTKKATDPLYGLSSPLVINADSSASSLEIFVASSTGSVMGLSSDGKPLPGWPVWLGPIAASPTAEDLRGNGRLGVCIGDVEGKVKCLTPDGKLLWEQMVIGGIADHITYGDVNDDGAIDVVFGTTAGLIYALNGRTGAVLPHFPVVTRGSIVSPVLLTNLDRPRPFMIPRNRTAGGAGGPGVSTFGGLSLVVPSHDGNIYVIDGREGCIETIDIDEKSSSMVLADDLSGSGKLDLLVTTLNGGVYVFETATPFHPLKVWSSKTKGVNGHSASEGNVGIFITEKYRKPRDIRGDRFRLSIEIWDARKEMNMTRYPVSVYVGSRTKVYQGIFKEAGNHMIEMRAPLERMYSSVTVVMTLPSGQIYTDTISLSFNMHFLTSIKYLLVIPFLLASFALSFVHKRHEVDMSE